MFNRAKLKLVAPCIWLVTLHTAVVFADFLAPYDPAEQNREASFAPGTPVHLFDQQATFSIRLHVCGMVTAGSGQGGDNPPVFREDCSQKYTIRWFTRAGSATTGGSEGLRLFGVDRPGRIYLIGTDQFGRDQFSRFLHGGRLSLFAGILACGLAIGFGMAAGAIAGMYGGWIDASVMWAAEVFQALPWLFFLFGLRAFLPLDLEPVSAFLAIVIAIGIVGWARPARLVRNVALSTKEREYVLVARGLGAGDFYLLRQHILPSTLGVALTQAALLAPRYILAEITLTYFGLGLNEPAASWGQMLSMLVKYGTLVPVSAWMFAPVISLVLTCYSYLKLADIARQGFSER
jgi:peptide/nickel transport system permease protein